MSARKLIGFLADRPLYWAIPVTIAIALAGTGDPIFREDVRRLYQTNPDIVDILEGARTASATEVLGWWTGIWIEYSSPYYRPLASMLFYAEYLAFNGQWRPFCIVTWLMQAGVCVLILLLMTRLWEHWPKALRVVPGIVAVALFSIPCVTTLEGPHWGNRGIARGMIPYWPGQTDVSCLLLSLVSLLLFDGWLKTRRRGRLMGAILAFVAALLFKEHAVVVPLLASVLAIRRRQPVKLVAAAGGAGLGVSALFLIARSILAPQAWGPDFKGPGHVIFKFVAYHFEAAAWAVVVGHGWVIVSAALLAAALALALRRPQAAPTYAVGALVGLFAPPLLLAGNALLPTLPEFAGALGRTLLVFVALIIAVDARRRAPTLALLACVPIVHLPILHVTGPHYYYWPVVWWSMFNAGVLVSLPGTLKAAAERAKEAGAARRSVCPTCSTSTCQIDSSPRRAHQMTLREMNIRVFRGDPLPHVFCQPRFEPWYAWHRQFDSLPQSLQHLSLREAYDLIGASMRTVHYYTGQPDPIEHAFAKDVSVSERREGDELKRRYETPHGPLFETLRWTVDQTWRTVEFPAKTADDLPALRWLLQRRLLTFSEEKFAVGAEYIGDRGVPQFWVPKSPYFALAQQWMKHRDFIFALADCPREIEDIMKVIDDSYDQLYEQLASSDSVQIINFGENVAMAYLSKRYFEEYVLPWYAKRSGQLRDAGIFTHIHIDGHFKPLLPYLSELPFDGLEALTPTPQGDVTLEEMREHIGDKVLLDGIPAVLFLDHHPREELQACTENLVDLFHPRLVLGISDELPEAGGEESFERLRWVADYCRSHGG